MIIYLEYMFKEKKLIKLKKFLFKNNVLKISITFNYKHNEK